MALLRKLFNTLKKLAGIGRAAAAIGLAAILAVAFAGILVMRSNASTQQKTPVATSASFASASSTETPTLAATAASQVAETPTDVSTPSNVQQYPITMPFTVDHVEIVENDWGEAASVHADHLIASRMASQPTFRQMSFWL